MAGLLAGIRVLDFGRYIAGPYAAMMLGDFGADVIRVERREGGEDRWLGPVTSGGEGAWFLNLNRNKRGMTLDPAHMSATEIMTRLVRGADVVIANLPFDVLQKLRLDYDSLRSIKDDIILVMPSAFGPDGPYRDRVGFDGVAQAMSGAMHLSGPPETPTRSVVAWADYGTALHAAFGALAALYHRAQTGRGQVVDVSLLATGTMFMTPFLIEHAVTGIRRTRQGNTSFHAAPSDSYRTRDGWLLVPTIGQGMFRRWARLVGREEWIDDPRFADDITRANNADVINQVMIDWCAARTRAEAIEELQRARIPCGPVYELNEVLNDPQVHARGLFEDVEFPGAARPVPLAAPPTRLSETPAQIRRRAPLLGEHTDEILRALGFMPDEIATFRAEQVI